ncbi:MAG: M48 family metallopeptidase [Saprospiraceae bacterium]
MPKLLSGRGRKSKSVLVHSGDEIINGVAIPFEVRFESRRNTRFSLTQKKAYLRMPNGTTKADFEKSFAEFKTWLAKSVAKRPDLADAHEATSFEDGQVWRLGNYMFRLAIQEGDLQGASAKTIGSPDADGIVQLSLKLPAGAQEKEQAELIEKLLFRMAAKRAQKPVMEHLQQINAAHFNVSVSRLKLSPTRSRWGSCSSNGTISISSMLLGAPSRCLHAVLVHELAHGIEMNHSDRFWKLVYDAMPDYDAAHGWLKENGGKLGWELV